MAYFINYSPTKLSFFNRVASGREVDFPEGRGLGGSAFLNIMFSGVK